MNELRNLAHGVEAVTIDQELLNGNMEKKKILNLAAEKHRQGNPAPATQEAVNTRGQTFGYSETPLGVQKKRKT